jgi:hypothetical protein
LTPNITMPMTENSGRAQGHQRAGAHAGRLVGLLSLQAEQSAKARGQAGAEHRLDLADGGEEV